MARNKDVALRLPSGVLIREANRTDASGVADLFSLVYGEVSGAVEPRIDQEIHRAMMGLIQRQVFVAVKEKKLIGYGRSGRLNREEIKESRGMIAGWFLLGLVVHPQERRRGVGHALTDFRLKHLKKLTRTVYYFAAKNNYPSINLHESFGFKLLATDFHHPNPVFGDGEGVLFRRVAP